METYLAKYKSVSTLEDIDSLLPQNFEKYIEELKVESLEEMKKYESFEQKFWI